MGGAQAVMAALSADKKNCEAAASASLVTLLLKRCAYAAPRAPRRLTRRRASAMLVAHTIARHTQRQSQSRAAHKKRDRTKGRFRTRPAARSVAHGSAS